MPISLIQVSFSYGKKRALHSVSCDFGPGATLLLGPNGAGKSTLLEVLASVKRSSQGTVSVSIVGGPGPGRNRLREYRKAVAWLPQNVSPYPGVRVREHVALSGWLKGMSKSDAWDSSLDALSRVALEERAQDSVKALSGGQLRRLGIAGALVHDAEVLLLDEPTAGLDPSQKSQFRFLLEELSTGRTVVVSSHDTEDAVTAFTNVVLLADGRVRFSGTMDSFVREADPAASASQRIQESYSRWSGESY